MGFHIICLLLVDGIELIFDFFELVHIWCICALIHITSVGPVDREFVNIS